MTDVSRQRWGVISSRGGQLAEQARRNLTGYLSDVERYQFRRLTLVFGPQFTNSPVQARFDPTKFDENWRFISDVRTATTGLGPADIRYDLLNEGASSQAQPLTIRRTMEEYVAAVYKLYAEAYGTDDVVVSSIGARDEVDTGGRLATLIRVLRSTGERFPRWFDIHLNYSREGVLHGLREADRTLTDEGLDQPLVVGETAYNNAGAAEAIAMFRNESRRAVDEVVQWYQTPDSKCPIEPPYRVDAFRSAA